MFHHRYASLTPLNGQIKQRTAERCPYSKGSQRPGSELIGRFQDSFGRVLTRRYSDGPHPTQPFSQDDIYLSGRYEIESPLNPILGRLEPGHPWGTSIDRFWLADIMNGENRSPLPPSKLDLGGMPVLDAGPPSRDSGSGLIPPSFLASQQPGCYTPKSSGRDLILHNQAGNLHSPSLDLRMSPFARMTVAKTQSGLDHFGTNYIALHNVQKSPDIQQQHNYVPDEFTYQHWDHRITDKFEVDPALDIFSFDSAAKPTTNPAVLIGLSPHETVPNQGSRIQGKKLRYHVALQTPTAMVESAEEIPISYLNKGQVYGLTVLDTNPPVITPEEIRYRTVIRVFFDDEEQRLNPDFSWRLWIEGRGAAEAQQRGSDLLAIEFAIEHEDHRHIQLEQVFIDGFCVTWNAESTESTKNCTIPLRFNFLSTDFSHSKGVKGVPVRLCAKTELLSLESDGNPREPEVCHCKVKLFRDHGAERKVANDLKHIRKSIRHLEQQIKDVELGVEFGKRRRANTTTTNMRDAKKLGYRRIQSGVRDSSIEDDLHKKLAIRQGMLSSARTVSVLAHHGNREDDPDLFPVLLKGDQESAQCVRDIDSKGHDLDLSYQLTPEQPSKPTACFFIRTGNEANDVFRAIYLTVRTFEELKKKICEKFDIEQSKIVRLLRIINDELEIIIDNDFVRELPEGQTMTVNVSETISVADGDSSLKEIRLKF